MFDTKMSHVLAEVGHQTQVLSGVQWITLSGYSQSVTRLDVPNAENFIGISGKDCGGGMISGHACHGCLMATEKLGNLCGIISGQKHNFAVGSNGNGYISGEIARYLHGTETIPHLMFVIFGLERSIALKL